MEQYQVENLLQGKWESDESDLYFEIAGNEIINISGHDLDASILKLKWAENLTTWQINIPFFEAHDGYIKSVNEHYFEVLNLTILVTDPNFDIGIDISHRNRVFRFNRV
jgi:hypothetical protein